MSKDAGTCIKENYHLTEEVVDDETIDHNLRFIGADPDNYVWFNNELWRIIGAMNNIDDGTGKKETRLKIIRDESIGEYSWDSDNANSGWGINEWSQSDIMKLLNPGYESENVGGSLYWNKTLGECFAGAANNTISCDFSDTGLEDNFKTMFGQTLWNVGANDGVIYLNNNVSAINFYTLERSNNTGKICNGGSLCNDNIQRTVTWKGFIALSYASDYGYATNGGTQLSRDECLEIPIYNWGTQYDCHTNNWMMGDFAWTMTISAVSDDSTSVYHTYFSNIGNVHAGAEYNVYPTIYLINNILIIEGKGTLESPFILSVK